MSNRLVQIVMQLTLLLTISQVLLCAAFTRIEQVKPVQNVDTGKYYDTIGEAIYDPETVDNNTIRVGEGVYLEHLTVNKSIALVGEGRENTVLDGNGTGPILKITASNVTVMNFTIDNATGTGEYGVYLDHSNSTALRNILIGNCHLGVVFFWAYYCRISACVVNSASVGIMLDHSSLNEIAQSTISQCETGLKIETLSANNTLTMNGVGQCSYGVGLGVFANDNVFTHNSINQCSLSALSFDRSSNCTFVDNVFAGNNYVIELLSPSLSDNNTFFYNDFLYNTAAIAAIEPSNIWDSGYPSGGNFWSDYSGVDYHSGPFQNETGSDGIGDSQYGVGSSNTDRYPLVGTFSDFSANQQDHVQVISNSTVSGFQFNGTAILFNVSGEYDTVGFCRTCIPTTLLNGSLAVFVNNGEVAHALLQCSNATHGYLYFSYTHSTTKNVVIVPEFQSLSIVPIFAAGVLLVAFRLVKRHRSVCDMSL